jgi:hypothetical protein
LEPNVPSVTDVLFQRKQCCVAEKNGEFEQPEQDQDKTKQPQWQLKLSPSGIGNKMFFSWYELGVK